jgi:hypothetical protein
MIQRRQEMRRRKQKGRVLNKVTKGDTGKDGRREIK